MIPTDSSQCEGCSARTLGIYLSQTGCAVGREGKARSSTSSKDRNAFRLLRVSDVPALSWSVVPRDVRFIRARQEAWVVSRDPVRFAGTWRYFGYWELLSVAVGTTSHRTLSLKIGVKGARRWRARLPGSTLGNDGESDDDDNSNLDGGCFVRYAHR